MRISAHDPGPIFLSETDGNPDNQVVYVKFPEKNEIARLSTSLEPSKTLVRKLVDAFQDIFLPNGYPESVSKDYTEYQLWDTIQAGASTVTSTLTTKVILQSVGVGNSEASAISAAITWILKDGVGMIARIVFAWAVGLVLAKTSYIISYVSAIYYLLQNSSGLDYDCKKWRLFADIVNDIAMCVELTVLPFYPEFALYILCFSTSLKALVGVAGGATRAAITQHQAISQNMADVSAKDGSQETCVNLLYSFLGLGLISLVSDLTSFLYIFIAMTSLHLYANYKAVKCLCFTYFNESRLVLAILHYLKTEKVPQIEELNHEESVLLFKSYSVKKLCGYSIVMGHSIAELIASGVVLPFQLQFFAHLYRGRKYIIIVNSKRKNLHIGLVRDHKPADVIEAYFHAVLIGLGTSSIPLELQPSNIATRLMRVVQSKSQAQLQNKLDPSLIMAIDQVASTFSQNFVDSAKKNGWDINRTLLPIDKWRADWTGDCDY